jgi:hypothetical protein
MTGEEVEQGEGSTSVAAFLPEFQRMHVVEEQREVLDLWMKEGEVAAAAAEQGVMGFEKGPSSVSVRWVAQAVVFLAQR